MGAPTGRTVDLNKAEQSADLGVEPQIWLISAACASLGTILQPRLPPRALQSWVWREGAAEPGSSTLISSLLHKDITRCYSSR